MLVRPLLGRDEGCYLQLAQKVQNLSLAERTLKIIEIILRVLLVFPTDVFLKGTLFRKI